MAAGLTVTAVKPRRECSRRTYKGVRREVNIYIYIFGKGSKNFGGDETLFFPFCTVRGDVL
jgi:hypothetical protein